MLSCIKLFLRKQATERLIGAGVDMDMESSAYRIHLKELVEEGLVEEDPKIVDVEVETCGYNLDNSNH